MSRHKNMQYLKNEGMYDDYGDEYDEEYGDEVKKPKR